jgi:hypothetical protein
MGLTSWALPDVMVVTLLRDVRYGNASQLSAYFAFIARCNMRKDERDVSEILKFDLFEETVGSWLRSIIKRLEEERTAISTETARRNSE